MQRSASRAASLHMLPSSRWAYLPSQSTSESRGLHGLCHHDWKKAASNEETQQPAPPAIGVRLQAKVLACKCSVSPWQSFISRELKGRPGSSPWLPQPGCHTLLSRGVLALQHSRNQPYRPLPECDGMLNDRDGHQSDWKRRGFGYERLSGAAWHTSRTSRASRRKRGAREERPRPAMEKLLAANLWE